MPESLFFEITGISKLLELFYIISAERENPLTYAEHFDIDNDYKNFNGRTCIYPKTTL